MPAQVLEHQEIAPPHSGDFAKRLGGQFTGGQFSLDELRTVAQVLLQQVGRVQVVAIQMRPAGQKGFIPHRARRGDHVHARRQVLRDSLIRGRSAGRRLRFVQRIYEDQLRSARRQTRGNRLAEQVHQLVVHRLRRVLTLGLLRFFDAVCLQERGVKAFHAHVGIGDTRRAAIEEMDRRRTVVAELVFDQVAQQRRLSLARLSLDQQQAPVVLFNEPLHMLDGELPANDVGVRGQQFPKVDHTSFDHLHPAPVPRQRPWPTTPA